MSSAGASGTTGRVIIRIASAFECESTVAAAADLARALDSEIVGLFVEEEGWFAAGGLPFPAMLTHSGRPIDITPDGVAAAVQREADTARRLFARAAERVRLHWSFQAERGDWLSRLGAAIGPEDIVVLRHDVHAGISNGLIDLALKLAPERGGVLLLPSRIRVKRREAVLLSAGQGPARLDAAARRLAERLGIDVLAATPGSGTDAGIRRRIDEASLVIATLEHLGGRDSWESRLLSGRFRTPLLLLRGSEAN